MADKKSLHSTSNTRDSNQNISNYSYCTFFDSGYLSRGLALIESIREQGDNNEILVVCLDDYSQQYLASHFETLNLKLASLQDLTDKFPQLLAAKQTRSLVEFYFTSTPFIIQYSQLGKNPDHASIYLDADLYFFGNPKTVIRDLGESSVGLIRHDYPWFLKSLEGKYGTYNVGLLAFRNNVQGRKVLDWWSKQCIDWCHDFPMQGKYADQGYLDSFNKLSKDIVELGNPGFNLAPWNTWTRKPKLSHSKIEVGHQRLTFFHFHGLKKTGEFWISSQLNYFSPLRRKVFASLYGSYVSHVIEIEERIKDHQIRSLLAKREGSGIRGFVANAAREFFKYLSVLFGQAIRDNRQRG